MGVKVNKFSPNYLKHSSDSLNLIKILEALYVNVTSNSAR
jgi:hypothetical protein